MAPSCGRCSDPALQVYPYLPATRADFLEKLGRLDEVRADYQRAASLTRNAREREVLLQRAHRLTEPGRTL
ncbi:MAG: hypothetical protein ABI603_16345 [Acidobacteriota bacterium]